MIMSYSRSLANHVLYFNMLFVSFSLKILCVFLSKKNSVSAPIINYQLSITNYRSELHSVRFPHGV